MSKNYSAVVAGHLCLDVLPDLTGSIQEEFLAAFRPGKLVQCGEILLSTGGPVSNTGLALHKLGIETRLMGKIGVDLFGQAVQQIVASFDPQLTEGMILDNTVNTSYTIVISPPGIDRYFIHCPGANDTFRADDVRYDLLSEAHLFHFGYPPLMKLMFADDGAQLVELFQRARQTGVTTSLDMVVPDPATSAGRTDWVSILKATLPYVDVFLPSIEETLFTVRRSTYDQLSDAAQGGSFLHLVSPELLSDLAQELIDWGVKVVGLKLGERGIYVRTASQPAINQMGRAHPSDPGSWTGQEMWAPCFQVDVVGTAGSGDATIAGFLTGLLRGLSLAESLTAAVAVGACNVEAADTLSGLRSWEETWRRVDEGWPRHQMELDSPGWRYDPDHQLWRR